MKAKLIFIIILGLVLFGVLMMTYGQTTPADIVGAAIILIGGGVAVFDCLKQKRNKWVLIPLVLGIITLVTAGFIQTEQTILVAVFGFIALGVYFYLVLFKKCNDKIKT